MNRIERYLAQIVVSHTLLVMLVLLVIFGFFEFMNQLGKLTDSYTLTKGAFYTLLKLPVYSYEVFPIVLLIGTLMGLGGLANQSELTVLRVTGWSIKRILWAVLKAAFILWIVIASIGEWVAPSSEAYAKKMRAEALHQGFSIGAGDGLWVKDANRYMHVGRVISSTDLRDIQIYTLHQNQLLKVSQVARAYYQDNRWHFNQSVDQVLRFDVEKNIRMPDVEQLRLNLLVEKNQVLPTNFPLEPAALENMDIETRYLSFWDLYQYIGFLQENDLDTRPYELELWRKIAMPIVVIAMIAIVFPLIFGSIRQVSMGQRIFMGVLLGMGFHLVNQLIGNLTVVYQLPVVLGAVLPATLLLIIALLWLQRLR